MPHIRDAPIERARMFVGGALTAEGPDAMGQDCLQLAARRIIPTKAAVLGAMSSERWSEHWRHSWMHISSFHVKSTGNAFHLQVTRSKRAECETSGQTEAVTNTNGITSNGLLIELEGCTLCAELKRNGHEICAIRAAPGGERHAILPASSLLLARYGVIEHLLTKPCSGSAP
mmetsp:Transcript_41628/g.111611  ORF Transcript_41628/g.111611 Transcript_41628/m.111611 type:complete len:173 (-) Transcript_41628:114-632(-)